MTELEKFEKFLKTREEFLENMLIIVKEKNANECFQIQLDTLRDIIHHYNVFVKGEVSSGLGTYE